MRFELLENSLLFSFELKLSGYHFCKSAWAFPQGNAQTQKCLGIPPGECPSTFPKMEIVMSHGKIANICEQASACSTILCACLGSLTCRAAYSGAMFGYLFKIYGYVLVTCSGLWGYVWLFVAGFGATCGYLLQ